MIDILQIIILILELIAKGIEKDIAIVDVCKSKNVSIDLIRKILRNK